jgi:SAM-dependent methyltransferase
MGPDRPAVVDGTEGYGVDAADLVRRFEQVNSAEKYSFALHLIPSKPGQVMDVGSGSGVDSAWFASMGHRVLAVEPTAELRRRAIALHPSRSIRWIDDRLPHLRSVLALNETFDFIVIAGVWAHLDETQRRDSIRALASLLSPNAVLVISIRQGVAPALRPTFSVPREAELAAAQSCGLRAIIDVERPSLQEVNRAAGVTWRWLALQAGHAGGDRPPSAGKRTCASVLESRRSPPLCSERMD